MSERPSLNLRTVNRARGPMSLTRAFILYWRKSGLISVNLFMSILGIGHQNTIRKLGECRTPITSEDRLRILGRSDIEIRKNGSEH